MTWIVAILLGFFSVIAILGVRGQSLKGYDRSFQIAIISAIFLKVFIALTMGHLDIFRFIYFVKYFTAFPTLNPWDFSNPLSDFPYPPILLYLHSIPFFFKKFIVNSWPLAPDVWDYMFIRIPLLVADILFARFLLKTSKSGFLLFLFSPLLLFHQIYSGQLDLIALVPFIFSLLALSDQKKVSFFLFLTLSMILKPFALLFFPFFLFFSKNRKEFAQIVFLLVGVFLVFKLSEYPFLFSESYVKKMGAGAKFILIPKYLIFYFFVFSCLSFYQLSKRQIDPRETLTGLGLFLVSSAVALVDYHSAGWLVWPLGIFLVWKGREKFISDRWIWIWSFLFVLRWSFVDHSPFFDSFDVFLKNYLHADHQFGMGYFYHSIQIYFSKDKAEHVMRLSVQIFEAFTYLLLVKIGYNFFLNLRKAV